MNTVDLEEWHFHKRFMNETPWVAQSGGQSARTKLSFRFYDYAPSVFFRLRNKNGIKEDTYKKSLSPDQIFTIFWTKNKETLYEMESSGQSGSLFYYTTDRKYMLKNISRRDFKAFQAHLKLYYKHYMNNSESLITRIYGLHKVEVPVEMLGTKSCGRSTMTIYFIIMDNVFRGHNVGDRYDLKGSSKGRD
jgi:1-phosphatidylinositol-4-phosphate 5-kinase